jgi:hypothetical protein
MHQPLNNAAQELIDKSVRATESYFNYTNNLLGIVGFPIGIGCISTQNPPFYAFLSLFFLWTIWGWEIRAYRSKLKILRNIKHPSMTPWTAIRRSPAALVSMLFLGCIAMGWFDTSGPSFFTPQPQAQLSNVSSAGANK